MSEVAHQHLLQIGKEHCQLLNKIVSNNGVIEIKVDRSVDTFECFAQTVVEQQLSYKAAKSIWNKIKSTSKEMKLDLIDYFDEENTLLLRKNGLSQNKIKSILGAKKAINDGLISLEILESLPYDDYRKLIKSLWGFGDWSAEMISIFYLGRTNVWSDGDLILRKGIDEICSESKITPDELLKLIDPYQSYLALHIWRNKD